MYKGANMYEDYYLQSIKNIIESAKNGSITVTIGNDDFDIKNKRYDFTVILGIIEGIINNIILNRNEVKDNEGT